MTAGCHRNKIRVIPGGTCYKFILKKDSHTQKKFSLIPQQVSMMIFKVDVHSNHRKGTCSEDVFTVYFKPVSATGWSASHVIIVINLQESRVIYCACRFFAWEKIKYYSIAKPQLKGVTQSCFITDVRGFWLVLFHL